MKVGLFTLVFIIIFIIADWQVNKEDRIFSMKKRKQKKDE